MTYSDLDTGTTYECSLLVFQVYLALVWCDIDVKGAWWQLHIDDSSWLVLHLILTPHLHMVDIVVGTSASACSFV
jgi:uncharacterized protein YycO